MRIPLNDYEVPNVFKLRDWGAMLIGVVTIELSATRPGWLGLVGLLLGAFCVWIVGMTVDQRHRQLTIARMREAFAAGHELGEVHGEHVGAQKIRQSLEAEGRTL